MRNTLVVVMVLLTGCGDSSSNSPDAAPDGPDECNALATPTNSVLAMQMASAPPTPQGGTVVDGNYIVTMAIIYTGVGGATGPTGDPAVAADKVTGNHFAYLQKDLTTSAVMRLSGTFATSGVNLTRTNTCPDQTGLQYTYDASPSAFTLYELQGTKTVALTFTKQ